MIALPFFERLTHVFPHNHEGIFNQDLTHDTSDFLLKSIVQNIECILQTRCFFIPPPPSLTELKTSLITYGIQDFSNYSLLSEHDLIKACVFLEKAISSFEPRLKNVHVTLKNKSFATFSVNAELSVGVDEDDSVFLELILAYSDMHYTTHYVQFNKVRR